jgi:hypothetical protein
VGTDNVVNLRSERQYRDKLMSFLCNKKPKLVRAMDGTYLLANVTGMPAISPFNTNLTGVYQVSIGITEMEDVFDEVAMARLGFAPRYTKVEDVRAITPV